MNLSSATKKSAELTRLIQQDIQANQGAISFARFMEHALYTPELGYYSGSTTKFGKHGDFITAPEISPLFAQCVAKQCQSIFSVMGSADILELGAGSGVFAKDLLHALEKQNCLPKQYHIVEPSADLRARQKKLLQETCPHFFSLMVWHETLPHEKFTGVIFANEVLDALPVHCFRIGKDQQIEERCVGFENNQFCWQHKSPSEKLSESITKIQQEIALPEGYESEINLTLEQWIKNLADLLEKGVILLADYGYGQKEFYHPDRSTGTLMCYYQHQRSDNPFAHIGLQDITAHVDFTAVIESAAANHCHLGGYTTQAAFLFSCGLLELAVNNTLSEVDQIKQNQAIKTLTLPSQMGEAVKVMALTKNFEQPLSAFMQHSRTRDL